LTSAGFPHLVRYEGVQGSDEYRPFFQSIAAIVASGVFFLIGAVLFEYGLNVSAEWAALPLMAGGFVVCVLGWGMFIHTVRPSLFRRDSGAFVKGTSDRVSLHGLVPNQAEIGPAPLDRPQVSPVADAPADSEPLNARIAGRSEYRGVFLRLQDIGAVSKVPVRHAGSDNTDSVYGGSSGGHSVREGIFPVGHEVGQFNCDVTRRTVPGISQMDGHSEVNPSATCRESHEPLSHPCISWDDPRPSIHLVIADANQEPSEERDEEGKNGLDLLRGRKRFPISRNPVTFGVAAYGMALILVSMILSSYAAERLFFDSGGYGWGGGLWCIGVLAGSGYLFFAGWLSLTFGRFLPWGG
jgi:hypothetical protein